MLYLLICVSFHCSGCAGNDPVDIFEIYICILCFNAGIPKKQKKADTVQALRRVQHSAKYSLPTTTLGEVTSQVPFGHLGTHFAELSLFAECRTRRSDAKWSPGILLRRASNICRVWVSAKGDRTRPFGTTFAESFWSPSSRRSIISRRSDDTAN